MWVTVPAVVLLAIVAIQDVNGHTEPLFISSSNLPADDQARKNDEPVISLEYKPIRPSYLSSGSNVAQIVPPGQPWPASAAGYANFSQVKPQVPTKVMSDVPVIQSSPTTSNIINLDLSNSNANLAETLETALAPKLVNVKPSNQQQTIPIILNITPPPNTKQDFVKDLQEAIKVALAKLIPSAGSSLSIAITQSSSGVIVNIKANLDVIVPAKQATPTLPPSAVPEIDLTESSSGLLQDLQSILQIELPQAGYNPNSKSVQNFTFSFSVLPPEGATKDYVKLYILGPLQAVLKQIAPGAALTSVSVNTQQSNQKILRQTVKFSVQIVPPAEFKMNSNLIEVPEVDLNAAGNVVNTVISTLQNEITKNVAVNPSQAKTLSIPFKITPPTGATQQQIQDLYINPISQVLSTLDPTGKIIKINQKTLPNGDVIILIYMNIPASTNITTSSNAEIQPSVVAVALQPPETTKPVTKNEEINNEAQPPVNIVNRNSFPEGEEDEIPEISEETSESTESETSKPSSNEDVVPSNAIRTSVVDLTTPTASIKNVKQILDEELSPLDNPKNNGQPKVLAIPFRMKPPAGATPQEIEENVVAPLGKLLTSIEPTGNVITSETKPLPNGDVESVVYFNIPSVDNSKTYKVISDELKALETSTIVPAKIASTKETITPKAVQTNPTIKPTVSQVISQNNQQPQKQTTPSVEPIVPKVVPKTELPQPQIEKQPENTVITSPIYWKYNNSANIPSDIVQSLKELKKNPNGQPKVIGIPFILPENQKPTYFLTQYLKNVVETLEPKGNIVTIGEPKTLANGETQFIIYDVSPTITEEKPSEQPTKTTEKPIVPQVTTKSNQNHQKQTTPSVKPIGRKVVPKTKPTVEPTTSQVVPENNQLQQEQTTPSVEPIASKVVPKTEAPQPEIEVQPKNAIITSPIDLNQPNLSNLPSEIAQSLDQLKKNNNGQPQVVGIPFILPGNQKPNFLLKQALKTVLTTLEPSGNILQVSEPKQLPNGDTQFIIYDEIPAVTNKKASEEPTTSQVISGNNQPQQKQTTPSVEPIAPKVVPKTEAPQSQNEVQPENAIITSPIDLKHPNLANLPSDIAQSLDQLKKNNNGQPQVVGIPFILPGNQKPNFLLKQALKTVLTTLEPSGNILQVSEPKQLPNGDTQFIIYDEIPAVTNKKPSEEPTTSQVISGNNQPKQKQTTPSVEPIAPKVVPKTEAPQSQNEIQPENAIITSPIDLKQPNLANLPSEIAQSLDQLKKNNNGQPQVVGIPFVLPGNQKPNFLLKQALKTVLTTLEPSGNILQVSEPKKLPNGDTQFIIYDEIPAVTNKKTSEEPTKPTEEPTTSQVVSENNQLQQKQTNPSVEPIEPKVVPKTEASQSQNEVQPENAIITSPIDLKQPNLANLPSEIAHSLDQLKKNNNGQPQVVGIPFVLPGNQKPNFLLKQALKTVLTTLEPSGNILQVSEPKKLPNGDTQFIIYDEIPAVTNKKTSEEPTKPTEEPTTSQVVSENNQLQQKQTNPSVEPIEPKVVPKTEASQSQNEVQPENAIITSPIDLKQPNLANLPSEIAHSLDQLKKNNNGQPQVVGIPFILPGNQKPNFLLKQALKTVLTTLEPSGNILQVSEPKQLPNGDTQFIIYDEIPAVTNKKPSEEPTKPTEEPTTSQVISENNKPQQKQTIPSVEPNVVPETKQIVEPIAPGVLPNTKPTVEPRMPKMISENQQPISQNEVQPENVIILQPIDLKNPDYVRLPHEIGKTIDKVGKARIGQPQIVGLPFILSGNVKPNFLLTQSLKTMLQTLEPSGNIIQITEPKVLPNGDTQFIIYDELPAITNLKKSENYVKNIGKSLDDIEKLTPHEPIVFPVEEEPNNEIPSDENLGVNLPVAAVEDVNLDQDGVSLGGEVTKALTKATSQILSSNSNQNEPVKLKFDIYTHLKNKLSDNIELVNDVSNELLAIEPNAKVITADTNDKPGSKGPDGVVEIVVPSIASSKIAQSLKNALKIPTIDINVPKSKLLDIIENLLQSGLKSIGELNPEGSQIFDLNFRLNPFDPKGSVDAALKALRTVDPTGQIISHKIRSGPDGWDYLDLVYQIPKLEDSAIYQVVKPNEPEVVYESFVNIDTKNPFDGLLENVVKEVGAAEDEVQNAKEGQLVDLPLDFKFTNSRGLSDSRVSEIISQTLPSIRGYINQILPDGKIVSVDTIGLPDSDDVILKIIVNTPYEPDDTIVIEEVRPNTRTVVTTPKPKSKGLFGILGL